MGPEPGAGDRLGQPLEVLLPSPAELCGTKVALGFGVRARHVVARLPTC